MSGAQPSIAAEAVPIHHDFWELLSQELQVTLLDVCQVQPPQAGQAHELAPHELKVYRRKIQDVMGADAEVAQRAQSGLAACQGSTRASRDGRGGLCCLSLWSDWRGGRRGSHQQRELPAREAWRPAQGAQVREADTMRSSPQRCAQGAGRGHRQARGS